MAKAREVVEVLHSRPTIEGAGVHLKRAFGFTEVHRFDPFLLLDDFHTSDPRTVSAGLPLAPAPRHRDHHLHAGGRGGARRQHGQPRRHRAGRRAVDDRRQRDHPPGDAQGRGRRAGCGASSSGRTCPPSHKMMDPRYREVKATEIPEVPLAGGAAGEGRGGQVDGVQGPVRDVVTDPDVPGRDRPGRGAVAPPRTAPATPPSPTRWRARPPSSSTRERPARHRRAWSVFGDGDHLDIVAGDEPARFLLLSRPAPRRAHRLVRADRHEHAGGTAPRLRRVRAGHVHQARLMG